ncbi:MAG TPA: protoporphyrinogen oxidase [Bryobacteraceae bacterium]|nr:protoporphyrinogen oxidase [Bryobacteraceae bacterium]
MAVLPVVIIGGGISGLAAAYFLSKRGIRATLIEKDGRLGGLIRTDHVEGCDLEAGPDSFLAAKPELRELAGELGIADQIISSNDERRRVFIARRGALVPMPAGMVMMAPSDLPTAIRSSFFSAPTKLRFLREWFAKPKQRSGDVSVGEFVVDHFGQEVLDTIAEPLLTGVYGGDASQLSMESVLPRFLNYERECGSIIRATRQERKQRKLSGSLFQSFAGGMETIVAALRRAIAELVDVRFTEATQIQHGDEHWRVLTLDGPFAAQHVILATPAHAAARLLETSIPEASQELTKIPYSSAILVTMLFQQQSFDHPLDGFGFLVPRRERFTIAASTWISTKFPSRITAGQAAVRSFIVADEAARLETASDEEIISRTRNDLRRWMGVQTAPRQTIVVRWPSSMPQYTVGHALRVKGLQRILSARMEASRNGLLVCGNAYSGVGIPDCIRSARQAAEAVANL